MRRFVSASVLVMVCTGLMAGSVLVGCGGGGSVALVPAGNNTNSDTSGSNDPSQSKGESFYLKVYTSTPLPSSTNIALGIFSDKVSSGGKFGTEVYRNIHGDGHALWIINEIELPDTPSLLDSNHQARFSLMIWRDRNLDTIWDSGSEELLWMFKSSESSNPLMGLLYNGLFKPGSRWWICNYDTRELIKQANGYSLPLILVE